MRILFTIAHFYNPKGSGHHGSVMPNPQPRVQALATSITSLHQLFGKRQVLFDFPNRRTGPVNHLHTHDIDVIVCTTRGQHLLDRLSPLEHLFKHHATDAEPMLLGFECHAVQRDALGKYDFYCFLEDDIILHDPWIFAKLAWFTNHAGMSSLLQPYRFEITHVGPVYRGYMGGPFPVEATTRYQNVNDKPSLSARFLGLPLTFSRTTNPHAGCYFLAAEQMAHWAQQPYFLDRSDTAFIGPLESAASVGIMRAFSIYKAAPEQANFFEVQHFGTGYLSLIGTTVELTYDPTSNIPSVSSPS